MLTQALMYRMSISAEQSSGFFFEYQQSYASTHVIPIAHAN